MFATARLLRLFLLVLALGASMFGTAASAQVADLAVTKTGPEVVVASTNITYTVAVTNAGPASAASVTLSDPSPANTTYVSVTQLSGPAFNCTGPTPGNAGTVNCTAATLAANQTAQFEIVFAVNGSTPVGTTITNTATAGNTLPDPDPANNSDTTHTTVAGTADLAVSKSGPAQAAPGSNVTYDVTISNLGPDEALDVTLTDDVPGGLAFFDATQTGGYAFTCSTPAGGEPGTISCTTPTFPAGASAAFQFVFTMPAETDPNTTFTNIATVTSQTADPNPENDQAVASTTTPALPQADLGVTKGGPIAAGPDTDVVFTITLSNSGPSAATNVSLQDTLPGTLTFVSLEQSGTPLSCTTPAQGAGGTITCTAATYAAGASTTLTLTAHVPDETPAGTNYTNTVTATSDNDPNEENNVANFTVAVSSVDLSVTKTAPATANAGDILDYVITVANGGPDAAQTVQLTDVLPAGTTFLSLTSAPGTFCSAPTAGTHGTVVCTRETLTAGGSSQLTLRVRLGNITTATNVATVTSESFDTDPADNSDDATTTVTPSADLAASKSGPASAVPGTNVTYTLGVTNAGPSTATSVSLVDALPANTTFVSVTQTSGPAFNCSGGATVTCSAASLAPEGSATFSLVVQIAPGATGSVTNPVTVSATTGDPNAANDTASVTTTLAPSADLAASKSGPATAIPGTTITYTLGVTNAGPSTSTTVSLVDTLPANTTFVSLAQTAGPTFTCTTPAVGAPGTVTCSSAALAPNASATFTLVALIAQDATGSITNSVAVSDTTADPNPTNDTATVTTTLGPSADLAASKSGPASAIPGTTITYTLGVTNAGPSTSTTVSLVDTLPANTTFVSFAQTAGPTFTCTTPAVGAPGTITCSAATLAPNASATFTLVAQIAQDATGAVTNTVTVSDTTPDPNPANDTATVVTTLGASADLAVSKSGPATAIAGTTAMYTIGISNLGPSNAANVTLTDVLPPNTTFVSLAQTAGPTFTCTTPVVDAPGTVNCSIATLAVSASASFDLVVRIAPEATGVMTNTATRTTTTTDPNAANDTASTTTTLSAVADLAIAKNGPSTAVAGDNLTYTITLSNSGPAAAANVVITDALPTGTTFVSLTQTAGPTFTCNTPATGANGTVTCSIPTFAVTSASFTLVARVSSTFSGALANSVTVSSTTADPTPANGAATAPTMVAPQTTDVGITKTPSTMNATVGATITYTLVVTNLGANNATGTTVTDVLPPGTTLVSATSTQGTCSGTRTITCTLGTLAPNATATITLAVTLPQSLGPVVNTATVTSAQPDPARANNAATTTVTVGAASLSDIPTLSPLALTLLGLAMAIAILWRTTAT